MTIEIPDSCGKCDFKEQFNEKLYCKPMVNSLSSIGCPDFSHCVVDPDTRPLYCPYNKILSDILSLQYK